MLISVDIDLDLLVDEVTAANDREELIELIKRIDKQVAEYDFTSSLCSYFIKEMIKEDLSKAGMT